MSARGMSFIHSKGILHLDLKLENVLVDARHDAPPRCWGARIADFGCGIESGAEKIGRIVGTTMYASPEMLNGERCTRASDIYSFSMLLVDLVHSTEINSNSCGLAASWDNAFSVSAVVVDFKRPRLDKSLATGGNLAWLGEIVAACWEQNPECRPRSFKEIGESIKARSLISRRGYTFSPNKGNAHVCLDCSYQGDASATSLSLSSDESIVSE